MTSEALPMLKMTSLSSSLDTCTPAWIFFVLTCSGTIVGIGNSLDLIGYCCDEAVEFVRWMMWLLLLLMLDYKVVDGVVISWLMFDLLSSFLSPNSVELTGSTWLTQVDLQAEVERERQREEKASKAAIAEMYDEVQEGIDADALFAAKLQQEEREEYTIEERAKFLAETIDAQRKFRAAQRSFKIRSRPPTKSQLRNLMMMYLNNIGGYKHSQLKAKKFAEIQDDAVKDSKEAAGVHKQKVLEEPNSTKVEVKQEGREESIKKRPGRRLKMKATKKSKRQKTDVDLEEEEQQTATGKEISNPFMAGSLPKTTKPI
ncbi:hypothetical protein Tco_0431969 [Tanacetum coccineum]